MIGVQKYDLQSFFFYDLHENIISVVPFITDYSAFYGVVRDTAIIPELQGLFDKVYVTNTIDNTLYPAFVVTDRNTVGYFDLYGGFYKLLIMGDDSYFTSISPLECFTKSGKIVINDSQVEKYFNVSEDFPIAVKSDNIWLLGNSQEKLLYDEVSNKVYDITDLADIGEFNPNELHTTQYIQLSSNCILNKSEMSVYVYDRECNVFKISDNLYIAFYESEVFLGSKENQTIVFAYTCPENSYLVIYPTFVALYVRSSDEINIIRFTTLEDIKDQLLVTSQFQLTETSLNLQEVAKAIDPSSFFSTQANSYSLNIEEFEYQELWKHLGSDKTYSDCYLYKNELQQDVFISYIKFSDSLFVENVTYQLYNKQTKNQFDVIAKEPGKFGSYSIDIGLTDSGLTFRTATESNFIISLGSKENRILVKPNISYQNTYSVSFPDDQTFLDDLDIQPHPLIVTELTPQVSDDIVKLGDVQLELLNAETEASISTTVHLKLSDIKFSPSTIAIQPSHIFYSDVQELCAFTVDGSDTDSVMLNVNLQPSTRFSFSSTLLDCAETLQSIIVDDVNVLQNPVKGQYDASFNTFALTLPNDLTFTSGKFKKLETNLRTISLNQDLIRSDMICYWQRGNITGISRDSKTRIVAQTSQSNMFYISAPEQSKFMIGQFLTSDSSINVNVNYSSLNVLSISQFNFDSTSNEVRFMYGDLPTNYDYFSFMNGTVDTIETKIYSMNAEAYRDSAITGRTDFNIIVLEEDEYVHLTLVSFAYDRIRKFNFDISGNLQKLNQEWYIIYDDSSQKLVSLTSNNDYDLSDFGQLKSYCFPADTDINLCLLFFDGSTLYQIISQRIWLYVYAINIDPDYDVLACLGHSTYDFLIRNKNDGSVYLYSSTTNLAQQIELYPDVIINSTMFVSDPYMLFVNQFNSTAMAYDLYGLIFPFATTDTSQAIDYGPVSFVRYGTQTTLQNIISKTYVSDISGHSMPFNDYDVSLSIGPTFTFIKSD